MVIQRRHFALQTTSTPLYANHCSLGTHGRRSSRFFFQHVRHTNKVLVGDIQCSAWRRVNSERLSCMKLFAVCDHGFFRFHVRRLFRLRRRLTCFEPLSEGGLSRVALVSKQAPAESRTVFAQTGPHRLHDQVTIISEKCGEEWHMSCLRIILSHPCFTAPCLMKSCFYFFLVFSTDTQPNDSSFAVLCFNGSKSLCNSARRVPLWPPRQTKPSHTLRAQEPR